jgi:hypothetical protein
MECNDPPDRKRGHFRVNDTTRATHLGARKSAQVVNSAVWRETTRARCLLRRWVVQPKETDMMKILTHLMPFAALAGGALILLKPPLSNYVVAVYLMLVGAIGLNHIYHFIR